MIAITHTPTDGTILEGTTRGDGTNQLLKPLTWRWFPATRRLVPARVAGHRNKGEPAWTETRSIV